MNRKTLTLGAVALALALPLAIHAGAPGDCPKGGHGGYFHGGPGAGPLSGDRLPPYLDSLNLSDAQRTAIKDILKSKGEALRSKMQERKDSQEEVRKLAFSSDYTQEKAKALIDAGIAHRAEVALLHADLDHAIFLALTPEQQQQVKEKAASFRGRHWKR